MWLYLLKRLVLAITIIVIAVTLLFLMIRAVPGDPAAVLLGPRATPEMKAQLHEQMGLDKPFVAQIATFFGGLLHGDLGFDVFSQRPVAEIVFEQLPYTIELILVSILWAVVIAVPLGCYSAIRRNSVIDQVTGVLSVATIAIPSFVMAVYALLIFAVTLRWLPAVGAGNGFWDGLTYLILPAFAIGIGWVGYISRLVRASMLEILGENHIRMARSFGISEWRIVARYALPPHLIASMDKSTSPTLAWPEVTASAETNGCGGRRGRAVPYRSRLGQLRRWFYLVHDENGTPLRSYPVIKPTIGPRSMSNIRSTRHKMKATETARRSLTASGSRLT